MNRLAATISLLCAAGPALAQRPWLDAVVSANKTVVQTKPSATRDTSTGFELGGRVGWRAFSVGVARSTFTQERGEGRIRSTAWQVVPRLTTRSLKGLRLFAEGRIGSEDLALEDVVLGGGFEAQAEATIRAVGGGITFSPGHGTSLELAASVGRRYPGSVFVDEFDIGGEGTPSDIVTIRLGFAFRLLGRVARAGAGLR